MVASNKNTNVSSPVGSHDSQPLTICDARLRPPFRRIGATSPSAHLLSGCGDSPPPPWRNQSWKDETGEKGRFQNDKRTEKKNIDMLSCKLSQKSTEGANFRYLRCLICGWTTWTISKGHMCQNYGAAACSSYISPDGQSLNLGPSHIPRRARVSITFNRRQSAKKPTLPILFKPWWTWLANWFKWFWATILGTTNIGKSLFVEESSNHEWQIWSILILLYLETPDALKFSCHLGKTRFFWVAPRIFGLRRI